MNELKMTQIVGYLFPTNERIEILVPTSNYDIPLFTTEELIVVASNLKTGECSGPDDIPVEVIKEIFLKQPEVLFTKAIDT